MLKFLIFIIAFLSCIEVYATDTSTKPTEPLTTNVCVGSDSTLQEIIISESSATNFVITTTPQTLVFTPSSGTFVANTGTVTYTSGSETAPGVTVSYTISTNQIEVTLRSIGGDEISMDVLKITGIRFHAAAATLAKITYTSGTLTVSGCLTMNDVVAQANGHDRITPDISGPLSVCEGGKGTAYSTGPGTLMNWSVTGGTPFTEGTTVYINWTESGTGTVNVSYTDNFGCPTLPRANYQVTINATPGAPTITALPGTCVEDTKHYSTESGKSNYDWVINSSSGFTTAGGFPSDDFMEVQWPEQESGAQVKVRYDDINGCTSPFASLNVDVGVPLAGTSDASTICSDEAVNINLQTTTSTIEVNPNELTQSGGTNSTGTGKASTEILDDLWRNTGTTPTNVIYTVIPIGAGDCPGSEYQITITVNPEPVLQLTPSTVCSDQASGIILTTQKGSIAAESFTLSAIVPSTGLSASGENAIANSGLTSTAIQNDQWINSSVTALTVSYSVTPVSSLNCSGDAQTIVATINPIPTTTIANNAQTINSGGTTDITLASNVAEATFIYTASSPPEITGAGEGSGASIAQTLNNNSLSQKIASYTVTASIDGCSGPISSTTVTVIGARTVVVSDSLALVALYNSTVGTNWTTKTNWFTGKANTWYGITIINGNVKKIQLPANNLKGTLPAQLGNFEAIDTLTLSNNQISGNIPAAVGNLSGLKYLDLQKNKLSGTVPTLLNGLTNLKRCDLSANQLTSIPDLSSLSLSYLDVSKNRLTFESLEPNMGLSEMIYSPQDSVGVRKDTLIQTSAPYTFTATVGGTANQYQWKKNNVSIPGATGSTSAITSAVFADEGTYSLQITNTIVTGLTLVTRPIIVRVSSLKRDSLVLVQLYKATNGSAWTNKTGWLSGKLATWNGLTITNNRVTNLKLNNNNLTGAIPLQLSEMLSLKTVDLSTNKISSLPVLTALTQLTSLNVSANKLDFASLEPNSSLLALTNYSNQAAIGVAKRDSIASGSSYAVSVTTGGINNVYQWKRNNVTIAGPTTNTYNITSLERTSMGDYSCEITNKSVPGLTLKSLVQTVLAVTTISGKLLTAANVPATKGTVKLFRITKTGGYDTLSVRKTGKDGAYNFAKVVLDNYQILGFADTLTHPGALPTFYKKTIFWEEADTVVVDNSRNDLDIISAFKPGTSPGGKGIISGVVLEANSSGRTKVARRVNDAGVCARRVENNGRGQKETLTLVAYVFTNANGEFEITNLPVGTYRLNIQYPGYPMDDKSFVTVPIGTALQSQVQVEATVDKGKITVRQLIVTESWNAEGYSAEVFPNPSSSFIRIRFASTSVSRAINLTDNTGRQIKNIKANDTETLMDVQALPAGNYLLSISENGSIVKTMHVVIE
jgi:Leucine-rich repeat (LRR) protein